MLFFWFLKDVHWNWKPWYWQVDKEELSFLRLTRTSQSTQAVAKTMGCSPLTDSKAPLLKTTTTQFIAYRKVELVSVWNLHPYPLVSGLESLQKEKPGYQLLSYNLSDLEDGLGWWWHRTCGSGQPMFGLTWGPCPEREPMFDGDWLAQRPMM